MAVDVEMFQHLQKAGDAGLGAELLAQKTGERAEADWRAILDKAGLKGVKIYSYPGVAESLIEAELA